MQIKKILVPIDLSEFSKKTLQYAVELADKMGAEIIIAHVITEGHLTADERKLAKEVNLYSDQFIEKQRELRKERIQDLIQLCSGGKDLKIKTVFRTGHAFSGVMDCIAKEKVDLLVMAMKGIGNLEGILVGSIAEKIFRRSPVPVLSIRG